MILANVMLYYNSNTSVTYEVFLKIYVGKTTYTKTYIVVLIRFGLYKVVPFSTISVCFIWLFSRNKKKSNKVF